MLIKNYMDRNKTVDKNRRIFIMMLTIKNKLFTQWASLIRPFAVL